MSRYHVAVIPGDGIGPEVVNEGIKVLNTACQTCGVTLDYTFYDVGGEQYLRTGEILPDSMLEELRKQDVIFLGAIGHPSVKPGILEQGILLRIRFEFDQYINLRPVKLYPNVYTPIKNKQPNDIDFVIVRENTGSLYTGIGGTVGKGTPDEVTTQVMLYTRKQVERCVRYAYQLTQQRNKKQTLTLAHKTNVLTECGNLWSRVHEEIGKNHYPHITRKYANVDALTMWMVEHPEQFDVIVTENMFGDIITDLSASLIGGLGFAGSGNINPDRTFPSMFEPVHGSAPDIAGKGIANPVAAILSGAMMMETLGETQTAQKIERAVAKALAIGGEKHGAFEMRTSEVGDLIASFI